MKKISADLNGINTARSLAILVGIGLVIVGFYFLNFNSYILKNEIWWSVFQNISPETGKWGEFGDYVGGILNPVIAAFAFYLIARTYELQKTELESTRRLLEVSTDAQKNQIELVALTALLNSNLTRISLLKPEKVELSRGIDSQVIEKVIRDKDDESQDSFNQGYFDNYNTIRMIGEIDQKINSLVEKNSELEKQIEAFCKEKQNNF